MNFWKMPETQLIVWGGLLNGIWEFAHSSLYTDHERGWWYVTWTRLHCTVGDVMILLTVFWLVSSVFRSRYWIAEKRRAGYVLFLIAGLSYTIFSEWWNTSMRESWQYAERMPVLIGLGLSPIAQWIVIPPFILRQMRRRNSCSQASNAEALHSGSATSDDSPHK